MASTKKKQVTVKPESENPLKKKKMSTQKEYNKYTVANDHSHIAMLVAKADIIELHKQTLYNDESQSITVTIHFK